jgi:hypothetical protein
MFSIGFFPPATVVGQRQPPHLPPAKPRLAVSG